MRKALSRVAAVAASAVLTTVLMPAVGASAATSDDCDPVRSKKIFTGGVGNNTTDHLWVDVDPATSSVLVCFQLESLAIGGLTIVANYGTGFVPPHVHLYGNNSLCNSQVAGITDPIPVRLEVGVLNNAVCLTVGSSTITVQFHEGNTSPGALPVLEIWRDGSASTSPSLIDVLACPVEWVGSLFGGPTPCLNSNARLFP